MLLRFYKLINGGWVDHSYAVYVKTSVPKHKYLSSLRHVVETGLDPLNDEVLPDYYRYQEMTAAIVKVVHREAVEGLHDDYYEVYCFNHEGDAQQLELTSFDIPTHWYTELIEGATYHFSFKRLGIVTRLEVTQVPTKSSDRFYVTGLFQALSLLHTELGEDEW